MMNTKKPFKTTFFLTPLHSHQARWSRYTLDNIKPEYLRECSRVHEKVHDSPPSTRLIVQFQRLVAYIFYPSRPMGFHAISLHVLCYRFVIHMPVYFLVICIYLDLTQNITIKQLVILENNVFRVD